MCWYILTETLPHFVSVGTLFRDRMSQIAEPSHVQLCLCNPNTGRNAKSSLRAVVTHPTFCSVAG